MLAFAFAIDQNFIIFALDDFRADAIQSFEAGPADTDLTVEHFVRLVAGQRSVLAVVGRKGVSELGGHVDIRAADQWRFCADPSDFLESDSAHALDSIEECVGLRGAVLCWDENSP